MSDREFFQSFDRRSDQYFRPPPRPWWDRPFLKTKPKPKKGITLSQVDKEEEDSWPPEFWAVTRSVIGNLVPRPGKTAGLPRGIVNAFNSIVMRNLIFKDALYLWPQKDWKIILDRMLAKINLSLPKGFSERLLLDIDARTLLHRTAAEFIRKRDEKKTKKKARAMREGDFDLAEVARAYGKMIEIEINKHIGDLPYNYRQDAEAQTIGAFISADRAGQFRGEHKGRSIGAFFKTVTRRVCGDIIKEIERERDIMSWEDYHDKPGGIGDALRSIQTDDDDNHCDDFLENQDCVQTGAIAAQSHGRCSLGEPAYRKSVPDPEACFDRKELFQHSIGLLPPEYEQCLNAWFRGGRAWLHGLKSELITELYKPPTRNQAKKKLETAWAFFEEAVQRLGYKKGRFKLKFKSREWFEYF